MKTILVSLVSDQTIPNLLLIKQFEKNVDKYLFITTNSMEQKEVRVSLIKACRLPENKLLKEIIVDQFSFDDIESKLAKFDFESYDKVVVNLTGGTKVMTLAAFNYFKEVGATILYVTGQEDTLIKLFPGRTKKRESINYQVTVREYLESYGFILQETTPSGIPEEYTNSFFELFTKGKLDRYFDIINSLRSNARTKSKTNISDVEGLKEMLNEIIFPLSDPERNSINKLEVKYLTGEWFEEYVSKKIKKELKLPDEYIFTGIQITKLNKNGKKVPNEMDVIFVYKNKIFTIECKTSVFDLKEQPDGEIKRISIISETLYKSDSLKQDLGLYANTFLFILDSVSDYKDRLRSHLERAELFNIKVIDKDAILSTQNVTALLNIC